ncbi:MAG TPA: 6-phosphogluconolactonase [Candidatus Dormibacteraeota bacterium]|jgi:6-phosphogluconolactonase|nr:6-phosphogluconolactonase [Candidatus Dormibacteraeota bacterium]
MTPRLPGIVEVCPDPTALAERGAAWVAEQEVAALRERGAFAIALAGGSTPKALYRLLAQPPHREERDWSRWSVYFGDERAAPVDDPERNDRMARESLLDHVPIPPDRVYPMHAERPDLDAAAAEYAALLETTLPAGPDGPRLDCILLGLGTDGHTASLFPGTPALEVTDTWVTRGYATYPPYERITVTFPLIRAAASVGFLVAGASKRAALAGVAAGTVPAARARPAHGELRWLLDRAAAGDEG